MTGTTKFSQWLSDKYVEWRGNALGNDRSITDFAKMLGITKGTFFNWLNAKSEPRSQATLSKLFAYFGIEVYEVLDIPVPETLQKDEFAKLPPGPRKVLRAAIQELEEVLNQQNIDIDSDEANPIAREIFKKHGITIKSFE